MLKITFTSSQSESIEFGDNFPYQLSASTGLSSNNITLQMTQGFEQNGMYYYGTLDKPRIVSITFAFNFSTISECKAIQKTISGILNPRLGLGKLVVEDDTGKYKLNAGVSLKPVVYKKNRNETAMYRMVDVVFTCPKPDWLSSASTQMKMIDLVGGLTLPFTLPFILAEHGTGGIVDYTGDNPARLLFDFRVVSGGTSMSNPKVTNQNGDYIQITKTLTAGQKILVDTNPDAPSIIFEDTDGSQSDAWDTLVYGSTFFQLELGTNTFSFSATAGDPEVYITYNEQYAGV